MKTSKQGQGTTVAKATNWRDAYRQAVAATSIAAVARVTGLSRHAVVAILSEGVHCREGTCALAAERASRLGGITQ